MTRGHQQVPKTFENAGEFRMFIYELTESKVFSVSILFVILLNTVILVIQTDEEFSVKAGWYWLNSISYIYSKVQATKVTCNGRLEHYCSFNGKFILTGKWQFRHFITHALYVFSSFDHRLVPLGLGQCVPCYLFHGDRVETLCSPFSLLQNRMEHHGYCTKHCFVVSILLSWTK